MNAHHPTGTSTCSATGAPDLQWLTVWAGIADACATGLEMLDPEHPRRGELVELLANAREAAELPAGAMTGERIITSIGDFARAHIDALPEDDPYRQGLETLSLAGSRR